MSIVWDLFCGAGGASTGLVNAARAVGQPVKEMVAVNHWRKAVDTHKLNHPWATVLCEDVSRVDPRDHLRGKKIKLGVGGPSCTHFSQAAGGRPVNDQERSHALDVVRWARLTEPENLLVENVPQFETWGPLRHKRDKKTGELMYHPKTGEALMEPDPARRGEYFREFLASLKRLGYNVDWRIMCAAHYGDATTRRRLFVQARRGRISWPDPTHRLGSEQPDLFNLPLARTAREIIDWNLPPGESIFTRKKPLAPPSMKRVMEGMKRFAPYPFIIPQLSGARPRGLDEPMNTITGTGTGNALIQPFLLRYNDGGRIQSIDDPITTIDGSNRFGLIEPFIIPFFGERRTQTPRTHSLDEPLPTITGQGAGALIEPFLISYYGTGHAHSLDDPLATITGKDRFALIEAISQAQSQGVSVVVDIRLRMLQLHELSAAHSFPETYQFLGTKRDGVKMVGNSWPCKMAEALCQDILQ